MGARYLDPKYSRWISVDPALGEYVPQAPANDDAKKHNQNLPGMGGIYNSVNGNLYHYAGNNPVRYVDPDGRIQREKDGSAIFFPYNDNPKYEIGNSGKELLFQWGYIKANDGTHIEVRINCTDYRPEKFNCHGFTFTDGMAWIQPDQVQAILDGDGYKEITEPVVGGIFVQYDEDGMAWHSGKIKEVNIKENSILVEEAMGVAVFKRKDGLIYDTIIQNHDVEKMGSVKFYKNEGDNTIED